MTFFSLSLLQFPRCRSITATKSAILRRAQHKSRQKKKLETIERTIAILCELCMRQMCPHCSCSDRADENKGLERIDLSFFSLFWCQNDFYNWGDNMTFVPGMTFVAWQFLLFMRIMHIGFQLTIQNILVSYSENGKIEIGCLFIYWNACHEYSGAAINAFMLTFSMQP